MFFIVLYFMVFVGVDDICYVRDGNISFSNVCG